LDCYRIKETGERGFFTMVGKVVSLYQERLKKLSEIVELTDYFSKKIWIILKIFCPGKI